MPGSRFFAILLIFLGVLGLLRSLGFHVPGPLAIVRTCWPLLLTFWGFRSLARIRFERRLGRSVSTFHELSAILFAGLGIVLTGQNLGWFHLRIGSPWGVVWSVLVIYLGLSVLAGTRVNVIWHVDDSERDTKKSRGGAAK